jgi:protein-L-isoaspartate(D-aspartate) O-methyltransferase
MDYADARRRMVDGQLRPNRVTDPRILDAMRTLPRERFLPLGLRSRAYVDEDVALPGGRGLMEPMLLARLVQMAAVRPDDRCLLVCAGVGYGAAVLASLGARVTAIEPDAALRQVARDALEGLSLPGTVVLRDGAPREGHPEGAPYEAILIEGAVPEVPEALSAQLAEGGRLVAVQGNGGRGGRAVLGRRIGGAVSLVPAFDCATLALPDFAPAPGFVF